jgi:hypothetical protein
MDCYAADFFTHQFTLADMQARTDSDAKRLHDFLDCQCTTNASRRSVKGREKTITGSIDFPASETLEFLSDHRVMTIDQVVPELVT